MHNVHCHAKSSHRGDGVNYPRIQLFRTVCSSQLHQNFLAKSSPALRIDALQASALNRAKKYFSGFANMFKDGDELSSDGASFF